MLSFKVPFVKISLADWKLPGDKRETDNRIIILEIVKIQQTRIGLVTRPNAETETDIGHIDLDVFGVQCSRL